MGGYDTDGDYDSNREDYYEKGTDPEDGDGSQWDTSEDSSSEDEGPVIVNTQYAYDKSRMKDDGTWVRPKGRAPKYNGAPGMWDGSSSPKWVWYETR